MIDRLNYFVRDIDSIDEYLYEPGSSFTKLQAKLNFENIDLIFFNGSETYLPWKRISFKFLLFMRMCIQSTKPVYACNLGFQIIYFFFYTNEVQVRT